MEPAAQHKSCLECLRGVRYPRRGLCGSCYERQRKRGTLPAARQIPSCSVEGCLRKHKGLGLCELHYRRSRKFPDHALEVARERASKWHYNNREKAVKRLRERVQNADDLYVRQLYGLPKDVPVRVIELGRTLLKLVRLNRERQKGERASR